MIFGLFLPRVPLHRLFEAQPDAAARLLSSVVETFQAKGSTRTCCFRCVLFLRSKEHAAKVKPQPSTGRREEEEGRRGGGETVHGAARATPAGLPRGAEMPEPRRCPSVWWQRQDSVPHAPCCQGQAPGGSEGRRARRPAKPGEATAAPGGAQRNPRVGHDPVANGLEGLGVHLPARRF